METQLGKLQNWGWPSQETLYLVFHLHGVEVGDLPRRNDLVDLRIAFGHASVLLVGRFKQPLVGGLYGLGI